MHSGDEDVLAPGLAALQASLSAKAALALPQWVLLASGSQAAPPAPLLGTHAAPGFSSPGALAQLR